MTSIYLSHMINENTPLYGGERLIKIKTKSSITENSSSNSKYLEFPNHVGTHIDFPLHFSDKGKSLNDYKADFWIFKNPYVIHFDAKENEIIDLSINFNSIPILTDFLIIKTGFQKYRDNDIYWKNNPGLSPELADKLKIRCPKIKVVGFDFISASSFKNRLLGRKAHYNFLITNGILLIEDMKLDELHYNIIKIICLPLMIEGIDGCPVTIQAIYE